jgi:hypothetical protein
LPHIVEGGQHLVGSIARCATVVAKPWRMPNSEVVCNFYNFGCGNDSLSVDRTRVYLSYDLLSTISTTFLYEMISLVHVLLLIVNTLYRVENFQMLNHC